ncbi:hypothetical protein A2U01_0090532, partial [Trifolium medium]|nr:hypothetical protein [Trifolium medium]
MIVPSGEVQVASGVLQEAVFILWMESPSRKTTTKSGS